MMHGLRLLLSIIVLNASAVGCSDDPTGNNAAEVPDPCNLIPATELSSILGSDVGEATPVATNPDQRKTCQYASGLILAVEVADHWETTLELMRDVAELEALSGIGQEAWWQAFGGGVGQIVALEGDYFVGVTVVGGKEAATAIAERMLGAL